MLESILRAAAEAEEGRARLRGVAEAIGADPEAAYEEARQLSYTTTLTFREAVQSVIDRLFREEWD